MGKNACVNMQSNQVGGNYRGSRAGLRDEVPWGREEGAGLQEVGTKALGPEKGLPPFGAGRGLPEALGRGAGEQTIGRTGDLGAWKEPQSSGRLMFPNQGGRVGRGEGRRADHLRWGRLRLRRAPHGLPCQPPNSGFVESVFLPPWPEGLGTPCSLRSRSASSPPEHVC